MTTQTKRQIEMKTQVSKCGKFKLEGNSLYELVNNSWIHVMLLPVGMRQIHLAVELYANESFHGDDEFEGYFE